MKGLVSTIDILGHSRWFYLHLIDSLASPLTPCMFNNLLE